MPRRAATVTQADIARVIRAMKDAGLSVERVVVRADGVAVETTGKAEARPEIQSNPKLAGEGRVVVL